MKKMMVLMAMMVTIATRAAGMSYTEVKAETLFLTDKMAYELQLSNEQYEAVYEINFDYIAALAYNNVFGSSWSLRNNRLSRVLTAWQYDRYMAANYFYRPVSWTNSSWHFSIYNRYTDRRHLYRPRPNAYTNYNGHTAHVTHRSNQNTSWHRTTTPRTSTPATHNGNTGHRRTTNTGNSATGHFGGHR
jgi:hypothetical protein